MQGKEELEHMVNEVMENLDTFVLEPAPQVKRSWRMWSLRSWRILTQASTSGKWKLEIVINEIMENLNKFVFELAPHVKRSL